MKTNAAVRFDNGCQRWAASDLWALFYFYNETYFGKRLPIPLAISFAKFPNKALGRTVPVKIRCPGNTGTSYGYKIELGQQIRWSRRLWAATLLHEMVHLEQRNRYSCGLRGKKFNQRMLELAQSGAFDALW